MENVDVKDLEGALIFISCETTNIDDEEMVSEYKFPFTFAGNELFCFEVSPEDVDENFDMSEHEVEHRGTYHLEKYKSIKSLADKVLKQEGEEYVKALYYDEELVVGNKFTFTLFNKDKEPIFTHSRSVKVDLPKPIYQEEEKEVEVEERDPNAPVTLPRWMERSFEIRDDKFRRDRRVVLFHIFILLAVIGLVWWLGVVDGWTLKGKLLVSITSGLYFTQWLWSNIPNEHLGVSENSTRRAAGRPWINGGFIIGTLLTVVNIIYDNYNPPSRSLGNYYMLWWLLTLLITFVWGALGLYHRAMNKSIVDSWLDHIGIEKNVRRVGRKQFIRSFFLAMLPIDWEIKIRNKHIERLDRESGESNE